MVTTPFAWRPEPLANDLDHIRILGGWDTINITTVRCDQLRSVTNGQVSRATLNHQCVEDFLSLWEAWEVAGLLTRVASWDGAYNPRYKRGAPHDQDPRHLSNHASGHAFDICAAQYLLGRPAPADALVRDLVPLAELHGWHWGGTFARPDPMHFQHKTSPFP